LDSRRKNAERIWEELERRRNEGAPTKKKKKKRVEEPRKKKQSGKQAKRLGALSEVVLDEAAQQTTEQQPQAEPEKKEEGMMDKFKEWYNKADSMAASQALLLNKKLEEEGIVEKITDETGLKVIGKEAAAKLVEAKGKDTETEKVKTKETTNE
jgi:predicted HNH restriction endonuclease